MTRFRNSILAIAALLVAVSPTFAQSFPGASGNPSILSRPGGLYYAPGFFWQGRVISGVTVTGSGTIIVAPNSAGGSGMFSLPDGTSLPPDVIANTLSPIIVDWGQGNQESVTPTSMSVGTCPAGNLGVGGSMQCLNISASFSNTHGQSAVVVDGSFGAQTAMNLANRYGGGTVTVDQAWQQMGGTNTILAGLVPFSAVAIMDLRTGFPQRWSPLSNATFLAVPATLTASTVGIAVNGAAAIAGLYTNAAAYHACVSYVDALGNEGPCSLDFSFTPAAGTTNSVGFTAPAASAGAVGWVPYISLTSGTYALSYRVNMATGGPSSGLPCTLTKVETVIAACALANTTYNQSGSGAIVSALTVNTARLAAQLGAASTTADIVSNSGGHTVYTYAPGGDSPSLLPVSSYAPFTITTAAATTVPAILGSIQLPAGFMNQVGKTIRICGHATQASAGSTATIESIQMVWDADGSNTTGAGVIIGNGLNLTSTLVTANADDYNFCEILRTTVAGAGATAGSIQSTGGYLIVDGAQTSTSNRAGSDTSVAATGSLNLAGEARIDVQYVHTTGTDAAGVILQNLTVEVLN